MSEFPHDAFAKNYLTELLNTIGKATPNKVIKSERREADLWFKSSWAWVPLGLGAIGPCGF